MDSTEGIFDIVTKLLKRIQTIKKRQKEVSHTEIFCNFAKNKKD